MIIPNRLLDTPSYKLLREILVKDNLINKIIDLPSGEFKDVVAGNIILILNHEKRNYFDLYRRIFREKDG